jgi:hypothetical protein
VELGVDRLRERTIVAVLSRNIGTARRALDLQATVVKYFENQRGKLVVTGRDASWVIVDR